MEVRRSPALPLPESTETTEQLEGLPAPLMSTTPRHHCSPSDFVREVWGLEGWFSPLPGDVDENWLFTTPPGERFCLKVAPAEQPLAELAAMARVQVELGRDRWPVPTPRVVPGGRGEGRYVARATHRPEGGWARLESWVGGRPAGEVRGLGERYPARLGRFLARLDRALFALDEPALERTHLWDVMAIGSKLDELEAIDEPRRRERVRGWIERFLDEDRPSLGQATHGLIHNDANDFNVFVEDDEGGQPEIVGLIDFGDSLVAPRVVEVAVAGAYVALASDEPVVAVGALLDAYEREWPLDELERMKLPTLLRMRVVQTAVTAAVRAKTREDEYAVVHGEPAWRLLDAWDDAAWELEP